MRKRTYKFTTLIETSDIRYKGGGFTNSEAQVQVLNTQLLDMGAKGPLALTILTNINSASTETNNDQKGDVWLSMGKLGAGPEAGQTKLTIAGSRYNRSFLESDRNDIIILLTKYSEEGVGDDAASAEAQEAAGQRVRTPEERETANNNLDSRNSIQHVAEKLNPGKIYNYNRTNGAWYVPNPDDQYYEVKTVLQRAISALYTDQGLPIPKDALLQASQDVEKLTDFLDFNADKIAAEECARQY